MHVAARPTTDMSERVSSYVRASPVETWPCWRTAPPAPCVSRRQDHGGGSPDERCMHARAAAAVPHIGHVRRAGGDAVVPAHLVLDALAPASLTRGRRPPPGVCAHGAPVPSREDEASAVARRTRRACSIPVSPARLSTNLRCFSNGCLVKIFVKRSAGLVSPGM